MMPHRDHHGDEHRTPTHIFERFGRSCTLDVAATKENALCKQFFTIREDGLKRKWHGVVWMNPPYSHLNAWAKKVVAYARSGGTVIALLPAWTETVWFQDHCPLGQVRLLRNRVVFTNLRGGKVGAAPFGSMIVTWSPQTIREASARQARGDYSLNVILDKSELAAVEPPTHHWLTPPDLYKQLDDEFHFYFDPFPYPRADGWDALTMEWGEMNYVNGPFASSDGPGLTAVVRKAIEEQPQGTHLGVDPADAGAA
jgi:phage N-6-adenine-methyltransferase